MRDYVERKKRGKEIPLNQDDIEQKKIQLLPMNCNHS